MAVSKVVLGNQTVMDITDSTVDAGSLLAGKKAYGANGEAVNGSLVVSDRIRWSEAKTSVKKNLIPNKATTQTINGITFTVNLDGSVLVNGTNTASDWATTFEISTTLLEAGEYYVSQSYSSEGAVIFLRLRVNNASGTSIKELGNKSQDSFTLSNDTNVYCDIQIRPNGVVDNVVIKPMIRLASVEDDTYVPYIPDNVELDEKMPIKIEGKTYTAENVTALVKAVMDELTASGDFSNRSFLGGVVWSGQDYHQIEGYAHSRYVKGILSRGDAMFLFSYDKNSGTASVSTINPSSYYAAKSGDTFTGRVSFKAADNNVQINFRPESANYYSTIQHQTGGDEATIFATKTAATSYIFNNGYDAITNQGNGYYWQQMTPGLQIKENKVAINKLIPNGQSQTYNLDVGGTINASGAITQNGTQVALDLHLDQSVTLSTSAETTVTFTNANIHTTSAISVWTTLFGLNATNMVTTEGQCVVTLPIYETAESITCRIYIK